MSAGAAVVMSVLDDLGASLSAEVDQHLEAMRTTWREGKHVEAWAALQEYKANNARWCVLSPRARASVLRFEAGLALDMTRDVSHARELAEMARQEAPDADDARLRTVLTYKERGPEAALAELTGRSDLDSVNLRIALHLEMGRIDDCRAALDSEIGSGVSHPETLRLRALVHLADGDVDWARRTIEEALVQKPAWIAMRLTSAMIGYYSALSPAVRPIRLTAWPDPVDWSLVRRDAASLRHLREAADTCRACLNVLPDPSDERTIARNWLLACLANDAERQDDAIAHCRALLTDDPTDVAALVWAIARRFSLNTEPSEKPLRALVRTGRADAGHAIALIVHYLGHGKASKAIRCLWETKSLFDERGTDDLWTSWYAQALVQNGGYKRALATIEASPARAGLRRTEAMALRAKATATGDWGPLLNHLQASYEATGDPTFLFDRCATLVDRGDWDAAMEAARPLVDACATEAALRLGVAAAYHSRRYDLCLALLTEHRGLFGSEIPMQIRRVTVACQVELGLLNEAVTGAQDLVREHPNTDNVLALLNVHLLKGDLASLAVDARRLVARPDVAPAQALLIASHVRWKDRTLAEDLWRGAVRQGLPDEAVTTALTLGSQLGLDADLGPLHRRMAEFGQVGTMGVRLFEIEGFLAWATERRRQQAELNDAYTAGTMPIHLIAAPLNRQLVDLYRRIPKANEEAHKPLHRPALFARHGGRAPVGNLPVVQLRGHLHLDLTALLLAAHLGILPIVEQAFSPLHLPADTPLALLHMMDGLAPAQHSMLHVYVEIVDLVGRDALHEVSEDIPAVSGDPLVLEHGASRAHLLGRASEANGYLVGLLPLQKPGSLAWIIHGQLPRLW